MLSDVDPSVYRLGLVEGLLGRKWQVALLFYVAYNVSLLVWWNSCWGEEGWLSCFTSEKPKKYHAWSCQNVCDALTFLLDNIFIRFGTKLYRQVVGIPMGTNCAPLVAYLFLFCYERDFRILFLMISRLMLLMRLTLLPDIWTIFQILIMFI